MLRPPAGDAARAQFTDWFQSTLEATQGQIDGFFSQLPYKKCYLEEVAFAGDWIKICPWAASRVADDGNELGKSAPEYWWMPAYMEVCLLPADEGQEGDQLPPRLLKVARQLLPPPVLLLREVLLRTPTSLYVQWSSQPRPP